MKTSLHLTKWIHLTTQWIKLLITSKHTFLFVKIFNCSIEKQKWLSNSFVVETFLEEFREQIIATVRSPGAIIEAWISQHPTTVIEGLTPQEQMTELFHIVEEGTSQTKVRFYKILLQQEPECILDLGKGNLKNHLFTLFQVIHKTATRCPYKLGSRFYLL